jgi:hypothetical protein
VELHTTDFGTSVTRPEDYWPHVEACAFFDVSAGKLQRIDADGQQALGAAAKTAQQQLYRKIAGMERRAKIDAGAYVYFTFLRPFAELAGVDLETGRWFAESDDQGSQAVAVIGWDIKTELFPQVDPLGRTLLVGEVPFRIIGLITEQGRTLGQSQDNQVFVPLTTFRKTWGTRNSIDMLIKARGGVPGVEVATDEVRAVLRLADGTLSLPVSSSDGGRNTEKAGEVRALGGDCHLVVRRSRFLFLYKSDAARSGLYLRDRFGIPARRSRPPRKAARVAQRDDSVRE